jgi:hypothetical protein
MLSSRSSRMASRQASQRPRSDGPPHFEQATFKGMTTTIAGTGVSSATRARGRLLGAAGACEVGRGRTGSTLGGLATGGAGASRGVTGLRRTTGAGASALSAGRSGGGASTLAAGRSGAGDSRAVRRGGLATGAGSSGPRSTDARVDAEAGFGADRDSSEGSSRLGAATLRFGQAGSNFQAPARTVETSVS